MKALSKRLLAAAIPIALAATVAGVSPASAQEEKPNILFIMGDDIGWMQPSIYHRGLMVGETPNIDRIGQQGAMFTDYVRRAELHRRAQRLLHRHASAAHRHDPAAAARAARPICGPAPRRSPSSCTISATTPASSARTIWATTRHALPTAHGFQEFWGYLYHLDAMQGVSFPDINRTPTEQTRRAALQEHADPRPRRGARRRRSEDDALPDAAASGPLVQVLRRNRGEPDLPGRGPADAGAVEDGGRGDLGQGHRLPRPQRPGEDRQAFLRLVQPGAHARHDRAVGRSTWPWWASPAARTGASTRPA